MQRVGLLIEVPRLLRKLGARPAVVLARVPLRRAILVDRDAKIPYASVLALLAECARATGCEHFGLVLGSEGRLAHLGLPGKFAWSSATVGQALEQFATLHWLNTSGGVAFLNRDGGNTGLGYAMFQPGSAEGTLQLYDLVMAIAVGMLRELSANAKWTPTDVQLAHARPDDIGPYRRFFRAPVRFNAEASIVHFPSSFESTPVPGADEMRRRALRTKLSGLGQQDLLPRLYRLVRVALLYGLTSGDEVAAAMGLHRRTFARRLHESGLTFRDALETVRFEAAQQLLRDTDLAVEEISAALGYAESSPFVRAFGRWSGQPPGAWRRQARASRRP